MAAFGLEVGLFSSTWMSCTASSFPITGMVTDGRTIGADGWSGLSLFSLFVRLLAVLRARKRDL